LTGTYAHLVFGFAAPEYKDHPHHQPYKADEGAADGGRKEKHFGISVDWQRIAPECCD
jgi:hypothetical protein